MISCFLPPAIRRTYALTSILVNKPEKKLEDMMTKVEESPSDAGYMYVHYKMNR